jgi:hypothetical protein
LHRSGRKRAAKINSAMCPPPSGSGNILRRGSV